MSFPTAAPVALAGQGVAPIGGLDMLIMSLNTNPYLIGTAMLLLNFGGRFIAMEMSKSQEALFQNPWIRRILIFTVVFVGTRNLLVAFWMTLLIILVIGHLFNENSSLCLFHLGQPGSTCASQQPAQSGSPPIPGMPSSSLPGLSTEESDILRRLQDKHQRHAVAVTSQQAETELIPNQKQKPQKSESETYWQNIMMLQKTEAFMNPRF